MDCSKMFFKERKELIMKGGLNEDEAEKLLREAGVDIGFWNQDFSGKVIDVVAFCIFYPLLILAIAYGYAYAWNVLMVPMFNLPHVTPLQAYIVNVIYSLVKMDPSHKNEKTRTLIIAGYVKVGMIVLFALVISKVFM